MSVTNTNTSISVNTIQEITSLISKQTTSLQSAEEKALLFIKIKKLHEVTETLEKQLKAEIVALKQDIVLEDEGKKIKYISASTPGYIDTKSLYNYLKRHHRSKDFVKVANVTEKSLKTLEDGKVLIASYKKPGTGTNEYIKVLTL